jgi:hypothetical protein
MRDMTFKNGRQYSSITTVCDFAAMMKQISGLPCQLVIPRRSFTVSHFHTLSTG